MSRRYYSSVAIANTLAAAVDQTTTTLSLSSPLSGWPATYPFTAVLDVGTASEEVVTVTGAAGSSSVTVVRGADGSAETMHAAAATLTHDTSARDFDEPNAHVASAAGVHGLAAGDDVASANAVSNLTTTVSGHTSHLSSLDGQISTVESTASSNAQTAASAAASAQSAASAAGNTASTAQTTANSASSTASAAESTAQSNSTAIAQRVEMRAISGGFAGPSPPSPYGAQYYMIAGSIVSTTNSVGGATANFGASFPSGVLSVVATLGEDATGANGAVYVSRNGSSKSGFSFVVPGVNGQLVRVNYIAIGW